MMQFKGTSDPLQSSLAGLQRFSSILQPPSADSFLPLFGASRFSGFSGMMQQSTLRKYDREILEALVDFRRSSEGEIRVLEIAGGLSYPQSSGNTAMPWLLRDIKRSGILHDTDFLWSDRAGSEDKAVFFVNKKGELSSVGIPVHAPAFTESVLDSSRDGTFFLRPLDYDRSLEVIRNLSRHDDFQIRARVPEQDGVTPAVFVRPAIDPELEEKVFGMKCVPRADFTSLSNFDEGQLDFVLGRNLFTGLENGGIEKMKTALERVLKNNGRAFVHFDGNTLMRAEKKDGQIYWQDLSG